MPTSDQIWYIAERLGSAADEDDARQVAELAAALAAEQGDKAFDLLGWLNNRTYDWPLLWAAAQGNVEALAEVRREAGLPVL